MRIISNFKDYYDSASSYGIDPTLIYDRKTKEISLPKNITKIPKGEYSDKFIQTLKTISNFESEIRLSRSTGIYRFYVLGCSGKFYPYIQKQNESKNNKFFTLDETFEDMKKDRNYSRYFSFWVKEKISNFFNFFNKFKNDTIFIELKSPLILFNFKEELIKVNPNLIEEFPEFVKFLPPFEMFNEVSQYVGNILVSSESPDIQLTDTQKATNHGFDKYSFRKEGKKNGK